MIPHVPDHDHIHVLTSEAPDPPLLAALAEFERSFRYPLGEAQYFNISHGPYYLPFFQAMGRATLFVATRSRRVLGTIACIERTLLHNGTSTPAAYLCDLKMAHEARQTRVLPDLVLRAVRLCRERNITRAWSVVMRGTNRTPATYTGRLEIPAFSHGGEIMVLRLQSHNSQNSQPFAHGDISTDALAAIRAQINHNRPGYTTTPGNSALRSQMTPVRLATAGATACGTLEDTRQGKRLILGSAADGDGSGSSRELLSTHLSGFAWKDPESGVELLLQALSHSVAVGIPGLFVAVPGPCAGAFKKALATLQHTDFSHLSTCTFAPADIYVHGLPPDPQWWLDTADI